MLKHFVILAIALIINSAAQAAGFNIESLSATEQEDMFTANVTFGSQVSNLEPKVEFINETIQIDIPNATVKDGKISQKVDGERIKSLLAYQLNKNTARFRMILQKGFKAERYKESFATEASGNGFTINLKDLAKSDELSGASALVKNSPKELDQNNDSSQIDEAKIEAELASLGKPKSVDLTPKTADAKISEAKAAVEANTSDAKVSDSKLSDKKTDSLKGATESEIPVLNTTADKKTKAAGVSGLRLSLGLAVVALFLFGMWVVAQRWLSKKNIKNPHTSIRVLTQHHLGPKKSLAIISVAGESVLIGITDQNISLIKTLSLLDEEIPNEVPQNFHQSLASAEQTNTESVEDFAMKGVKDIVSDKLKGMRNLW